MGQAVNTYLTHTPTADGVTASVRSFRRPGSSVGARWVGLGCRFSARHPGDLPASAFSAREAGTILLSGTLWPIASFGSPGGHSLSWGTQAHRPGPEIQWMLSPVPFVSPDPCALDVPATFRTPSVVPDPR